MQWEIALEFSADSRSSLLLKTANIEHEWMSVRQLKTEMCLFKFSVFFDFANASFNKVVKQTKKPKGEDPGQLKQF